VIAVYPALHSVKAVLLTDVVMMYTRCEEADILGVEIKVQQSEISAQTKCRAHANGNEKIGSPH